MDQRAVIITDLGYGDAGKGTTVDYLVRQVSSAVVVRHNGGSQAAHNVVTPDGRHHTFAQFASGSFVPGVRTHLSRFMLLNPLNMFPEAEHLQAAGVPDIWDRLSVDEAAVVITPWHIAANQLREIARGASRHGSTGQGVGETKVDLMRDPDSVIRVRDLRDAARLRHRLRTVRDQKFQQLQAELPALAEDPTIEEWRIFHDELLIETLVDWYREWAQLVRIVAGDYLATLMRQVELTVFEGAQGVLLDEWYGFQPYTTWSNALDANARTLLSEAGCDLPVTRLGVIRAYATRHGPGPFVTEDPNLTQALPDYHNGNGRWQGLFRVGFLDLLTHRYAVTVTGGIDEIAVTGFDRLACLPEWKFCDAYRYLGDPATAFPYLALHANGEVNSINVPPYGDYEYGCNLTTALMSCMPIYQSIDGFDGQPGSFDLRVNALCAVIESSLGVPVTIRSFGPTAADKQALVAC